MSMPSFPLVDPKLTLEKAIYMILSSIASEENSLSDIIKAEGEKIEFAIKEVEKNGDAESLQKLIEVNDSVNKLMDKINDTMILLKSKMNTALEYVQKPPRPPVPPVPPIPPRPPVPPIPCPPIPCPHPPIPCPCPPMPMPPCLPDNISCGVLKCKCDTIVIECDSGCGCDKKCDLGCGCEKNCGCDCKEKPCPAPCPPTPIPPCPPPMPIPPLMSEEFFVIPDMQWRNGEALCFVNPDFDGCGCGCNGCANGGCSGCNGCGNCNSDCNNGCNGCANGGCGGCNGFNDNSNGNCGCGNINAIDLPPGMYTIEFEFKINRGMNTPKCIDIELFLGCENKKESYVNYSQELQKNCTFSGGLIFETPCDCSECMCAFVLTTPCPIAVTGGIVVVTKVG